MPSANMRCSLSCSYGYRTDADRLTGERNGYRKLPQKETSFALDHPYDHVRNVRACGAVIMYAISNDLSPGEFAVYPQLVAKEDIPRTQREENLDWISEYAVEILRQQWGSQVPIRP